MNSDKRTSKFPLLEIGIGLGLILSLLWFVQDYLASFLCLLIPALALSLMAVSYIAELLEKSNLPFWYYRLMWMLVLIPLILLLIFGSINHFHFDWTRVN